MRQLEFRNNMVSLRSILLVSVIYGFSLMTGCQNDLLTGLEDYYSGDVRASQVRPVELDSFDRALGDLTLISQIGSREIRWNLEEHSALDETGHLQKPPYPNPDVQGTIQATVLFRNGKSQTFIFPVRVPASSPSDAFAVSEAITALTIAFATGDAASSVTGSLGLATQGLHSTQVSWNTSALASIATDGAVLRPSYAEGDESGTIIATVTKGTESSTKSFPLTVMSLPLTDSDAVTLASTDLSLSFAGEDTATSVTASLTLPLIGLHGTTVSWDASGHSSIGDDGSVSLPAGDWWDTNINSVTGEIVATVTKNAVTTTRPFSLTVVLLPPVASGFSIYAPGGYRYLQFSALPGTVGIGNYEFEYRRPSADGFTAWAATPPPGAATTGANPARFGWTQAQLPQGDIQFRVRIVRNGVYGAWAETPQYSNF
ncbi:MAG: hypothetical protein MI717_07480 [Spirochaetales bacterium]|nr:hypothetical protein [Spirochaetales bacterium]